MCAFRSVLLVLFVTCSSAQAIVIVDSNLEFGGTFPTYGANIWQNPTRTDNTLVSFQQTISSSLESTLRVSLVAFDEGSDWYLVGSGKTFSSETIANGKFPVLNQVGSSNGGPVDIPVGDFYLGVRTGQGFYPTPEANRNV